MEFSLKFWHAQYSTDPTKLHEPLLQAIGTLSDPFLVLRRQTGLSLRVTLRLRFTGEDSKAEISAVC